MNALYLFRHSLTEANARRLYGGSTDLPLTEAGQALAQARAGVAPPCALYVTSGMRRADETLWLMAQKRPDRVMAGLREMDFGAFEMRGYDELKHDPDYLRWIEDDTGAVACPGGECANAFRARVLEAGAALLALAEDTACVVCHGGTITRLMEAWFPERGRHYYEWQPDPCAGYKIVVKDGVAADFEEV